MENSKYKYIPYTYLLKIAAVTIFYENYWTIIIFSSPPGFENIKFLLKVFQEFLRKFVFNQSPFLKFL